MKKLKLVPKGSLSEKKFLEQKKQEGYYLIGVINGVYSFKHDPVVKDTELQINFIKTDELNQHDNTSPKDNPFFSLTHKRLKYSKYSIVYSYLKDKDNPIYKHTETKMAEYQYLKHLQNINFTIITLIIFLSVLFWAYFVSQGNSNPTNTWLMKLMLILFMISLGVNLSIKRRIRKNCPTYVDQFYKSYNVSIQSDEQPNLEKLKHLGAWRYIMEKNGKYYYTLQSKQPKSTIEHSICTRLDLKKEQLFVYSTQDLFAIRMHF